MENESKFCVYCHTNKINGKKYVGLSSNPKRRWSNGKGYATQYFGVIIEYYGWDNFTHDILESGLTLEQAQEREIYYIALYHSNDFEYGYNCSEGGEYTSHKIKVNQYDMDGKYIKTWDSMCQASIELNIDASGIWHCSTHTYKKTKSVGNFQWEIYETHSDCNNIAPCVLWSRPKQINQYDINGNFIKTWDSAYQIQQILGIEGKSVGYVCNYRSKTAGGYVWRYVDESNIHGVERQPCVSRKVGQFDFDGNLIATYDSIKQAHQSTNINRSNINSCVNGKAKSAGGYIWKPLN